MGSGGRDRERCAPKLYKSPSSLFPVGTRPRSLLSTVTSIAIIPVSLCGPVLPPSCFFFCVSFSSSLCSDFVSPRGGEVRFYCTVHCRELVQQKKRKGGRDSFPPGDNRGFPFYDVFCTLHLFDDHEFVPGQVFFAKTFQLSRSRRYLAFAKINSDFGLTFYLTFPQKEKRENYF